MKLTLKQLLLFFGLIGVVTVLAMLGFKSQKLKDLATKLLRAQHDIEIQKSQIEIDRLKKKSRSLDAERREKITALRDYIDQLNSK